MKNEDWKKKKTAASVNAIRFLRLISGAKIKNVLHSITEIIFTVAPKKKQNQNKNKTKAKLK